MTDSSGDIGGISALADPVRRGVYEYVIAQDSGVSREQAADALNLPRHQATFHLERLERAGLLEAGYARLTGRSGPGAGRPSKLYRRSPDEVAVSLPARQYALAGELLAGAIDLALQGEVPLADALESVAVRHGAEIAESVEETSDPLDTATAVLRRLGYEPRRDGGRLVLVNCPFHALARQHTALVCGMNHDLLGAVCARLGGLTPRLEPGPGRCCVVIDGRPGRVQEAGLGGS